MKSAHGAEDTGHSQRKVTVDGEFVYFLFSWQVAQGKPWAPSGLGANGSQLHLKQKPEFAFTADCGALES